MTEAELVAIALATGAAAAHADSARGPVHDLYLDLRTGVRQRLGGACGQGAEGYGARVLDAYETDADVWWNRLLNVLSASGVETDPEILTAARAVLRAERRTGQPKAFVR